MQLASGQRVRANVAQSACIAPGIALGAIMSRATRVRDEMVIAAARVRAQNGDRTLSGPITWRLCSGSGFRVQGCCGLQRCCKSCRKAFFPERMVFWWVKGTPFRLKAAD